MTIPFEAITLDFGNTLVPFPAGPMAEVVRLTAERTAALAGCSVDDFVRVWGEERLRQFAEEVPAGREADMDVRAARVLARLRGRAVPPDGTRWDDAAVATYSEPGEVEDILNTYADAFVRKTPVPPGIGPMLPARDPLQLAAGAGDRPLRGERRLAAPSVGRRCVAPGRRHQAMATDLRASGVGTRCGFRAGDLARR